MSTRRPAPSQRPAPPAGPRRPSKAVYRRRRIVALLLLLAVLALAAWGVSALVTVLGGSTQEGAGTDAAASEGTPDGSRPEPCAVADLEVDLEAPEQVAAGSAVPFAVTVTNAGAAPCMVDAGSASLAVTVRSGEDRVWSSADCPAGQAERMLLLDAGDSSQVELSWSGRRSAEGCAGGQGTAGAGTYRAGASLHGTSTGGAEAVFELR